MSYIAAALARARGESAPPGKDGTTLPPLPEEDAASFSLRPYAGATKPKNTFPWHLTLIGLGVLSAAAAGVRWWEKSGASTAEAPHPASHRTLATVAAPAPDPDATATPEPTAAMTETVRTLAVSAALAGPSQRVVVAGKVYLPGDTVAAGLVLQEVHPGLIVFHDAAGAVYTRRF